MIEISFDSNSISEAFVILEVLSVLLAISASCDFRIFYRIVFTCPNQNCNTSKSYIVLFFHINYRLGQNRVFHVRRFVKDNAHIHTHFAFRIAIFQNLHLVIDDEIVAIWHIPHLCDRLDEKLVSKDYKKITVSFFWVSIPGSCVHSSKRVLHWPWLVRWFPLLRIGVLRFFSINLLWPLWNPSTTNVFFLGRRLHCLLERSYNIDRLSKEAETHIVFVCLLIWLLG